MSLECRSALYNCRSAVAPKHVLPERHLRLPERLLLLPERCVFSVGAPYATSGALWL
ncbi:hypothetical protein AMTRI_Chr11g98360 [Amborella trichopoda]